MSCHCVKSGSTTLLRTKVSLSELRFQWQLLCAITLSSRRSLPRCHLNVRVLHWRQSSARVNQLWERTLGYVEVAVPLIPSRRFLTSALTLLYTQRTKTWMSIRSRSSLLCSKLLPYGRVTPIKSCRVMISTSAHG